MIAIVSCLAGVLGMLALWCWAWRLWPRTVVLPPPEPRHPRLVWHGDLAEGRRRPTPPPGWLFVDAQDDLDNLDDQAAPTARTHPSSNTDTNLFARERGPESLDERTEVLSEEQMLDPGETQPSLGGKTCRIGLFAGPRSSGP